ncbi:MAG: pyridoxal phosphate-dependent decarboxylase family protein [Acidobacteriota bacterium]
MNAESRNDIPDIEVDRSLEPAPETIRSWVQAAVARIVSHLESLPDQPLGYDPSAIPRRRTEPVPETGMDLERLLDHLFEEAIPASFNTASPGYLGYIPGGGLFHAALADLISSSINRYVGVYVAAPRLVRLEADVVGWFANMMGFPESARGVLTTGGSMSNFTALVTARQRLLPEDFLLGTLYASDQAHHSVWKAARLAGFPRDSLRIIPTDVRRSMRTDVLRRWITRDRRRDRSPFLVVASAGTTNTGAVDDLEELAEICREEALWLHVDAAYGGFFRLTRTGRQVLAGMERADSITLDPHKGLFLPYGTGALLVRDGGALEAAHAITADYMPDMPAGKDKADFDFSQHSMELSRSFRGLRVWLPLKLHGIGPFITNLEEKLALTRRAAEDLHATEGIEIVAEPQLSILAFRLVRQGLSPAAVDALNKRLLEKILARQRVFLTATTVEGRFVIRLCILSFRTHQDRVDECIQIIREEAKRLLRPSRGDA